MASSEEVAKELQAMKEKLAAFNKKRLYEDPKKEEAFRMFKLFDVDNSDDVNAKEFQELAFQLGETMSKEEVAQTLKMIDTDGNGTVSFEEFYQWWTGDEHEKLKKARNPTQIKKMKALKAKLQSQTYMNSVMRFVEAAQKSAREEAADKQKLASVKYTANVSLGEVKSVESSINISHKVDAKEAQAIIAEHGVKDSQGALSLIVSFTDDATEEDANAFVKKALIAWEPLREEDKLFKGVTVTGGVADGRRVCTVSLPGPPDDRDIKELAKMLTSLQVKNFSASIKMNQALGQAATEPLAISVSAEMETTRAGATLVTQAMNEMSGSRRRRKGRRSSDDYATDYWAKLGRVAINVGFDDVSSLIQGFLGLDKKMKKATLGAIDFDNLGLAQLKLGTAMGIIFLYDLLTDEEDAKLFKPFIDLYEQYKSKVRGIHGARVVLGDTIVQLSITGFDLAPLLLNKDEAMAVFNDFEEKHKALVKSTKTAADDDGSGSDNDNKRNSPLDDLDMEAPGSRLSSPTPDAGESKRDDSGDESDTSRTGEVELSQYAKKVNVELAPDVDSDISDVSDDSY